MEEEREEGQKHPLDLGTRSAIGTGRIRRPSDIESVAIELVSALFIFIGLGLFAILFVGVNRDPAIQLASQWPPDDMRAEAIADAQGNVQDYSEDVAAALSAATIVPGTAVEDNADLMAALQAVADSAAGTDVDVDVNEITTLLNRELEAVAVSDGSYEPQALGEAIGRVAERGVDVNRDAVDAALEAQRPSVILAFLDSNGIVLPIMMIVAGVLFIRLGLRMRQREINAAKWAQVALTWIVVGLVIVIIVGFIDGGTPKPDPITRQVPEGATFDFIAGLAAIILPIIGLIPAAMALWWLNHVADEIFAGEETISSRESRMAWNLLIPTLAVLIIVAARPLEETFIVSLTDKRFASGAPVNFVGLDNYTELLGFRFDSVVCEPDPEDATLCRTRSNGSIRWENQEIKDQGFDEVFTVTLGGNNGLMFSGRDELFWESLGNTLAFTVISVSIELVIGLFMAMVVNSNFRGRGMMRMAMLAPWAIPTVISAKLWDAMLRDNGAGVINRFLLDTGLIQNYQTWMTQYPIQSVIAVDVWKTAPFMALLILAGLQTIPGDLYEAASVDGANRVRQFFSVTLPLLRPTIAVALVFRILDALRVFDVFQVLLGADTRSLATYNYSTLIDQQQAGGASAIGVVMFILISIFAVFIVRYLGVDTE